MSTDTGADQRYAATTASARPQQTRRGRSGEISRVPYLPGLDGMRALAVVAVMVYHANADWLPGGYLGVEVFFVISGYLITLLLIAEKERSYTVDMKQFWIRRARRLLPALFAMLLMLTIWVALFERDELGKLRGDVVAALLYVSNWYQIWIGAGYTAANEFAPLRHLWSLAVEEQFYLVWPLVMFALLRGGTRRIADISRWLVLAALGITLVTAVVFPSGPIGTPEVTPDAYWSIFGREISIFDWAYLGTFSRASGLLLGAAFAMVWRPVAVMRGPLRTKGPVLDVFALVGFVGLAAMCWWMWLVSPSGGNPWLFRGGLFLVGLATLAMIAAVTHRGAATNRVLGNPLFRWVGTRSYGLYLYHWPIYQMIRDVAGNKLTVHEFVIAMLLTAIVTELSYRLIETPIRRGRFLVGWRRIRTRAARGPKLVLTAGVAALAVTMAVLGAALFTAPVQDNEIAEALDAGEGFTVDLLTVDDVPAPVTTTTVVAPTTTAPPVDPTAVPGAVVGPAEVDRTGGAPAAARAEGYATAAAPATTAPPTTPAPTTAAPTTVPATTTPPQPVTQLGVVSTLSGLPPLVIPPTEAGFPLVALGDSVMLGAAEELQARGFQVDAQVSRQMKDFVPTMAALRDNGTFGSVVVVHLGTNGGFSQGTLDQMLSTVADVPVVLLLTGKADRARPVMAGVAGLSLH